MTFFLDRATERYWQDQKPAGALHTSYGTNLETHTHEVTCYLDPATSEHVTIDHDLTTNRVDVVSSERTESLYNASVPAATAHLVAKEINHTFRMEEK